MTQIKKVPLEAGEVHCTRCSGYGLYLTQIDGGKGVVASTDGGVCYRCKGLGVDPSASKKPEIRQDPLFEEAFKVLMREAMSYIYGNELLGEAKVVLKYASIARKLRIPTSQGKEVVEGLVQCGYVKVDLLFRRTSICATDQGMTRYARFIEQHKTIV